MSVCPVYQSTLREEDVARGRLCVLEQMEKKDIQQTERLSEILSRCLLCGACADACVNQVDATALFQKGRESLATMGKGWFSKHVLVKNLSTRGWHATVTAKGGALFESLFCHKIPGGCGLHLRFPLSFFTKRSVIPEITWKPFLNRSRHPHQGDKKRRVALFVGCGSNYLFPQIAEALLGIMDRFGVAVEIPTDQVCCGLPAFVAGDTETARDLATRNLEAFEGLEVEAVLTVCASCGAHLEHMGRCWTRDPHAEKQARFWSEKHRDAMAFLVENMDMESSLGQSSEGPAIHGRAVTVSYHDPCHLRIAQKQTRAPRILLESLNGVTLKEAPHAGRCCGHGGAFNLSHYDLSMDMCGRRMDDFKRIGPDVIATGCTGCLLQLQEGVVRSGMGDEVEVCHPLIIVDRVIKDGRM